MNPAEQPAEDRFASLAADFDALGNEQRLRLLEGLTTPRYAEEIGDALGITRQAAAKHVERLLERGFVRALNGRRSRGPVIEYLVVPQKLFALSQDLHDLAKLEPSGGPAVRRADPTVAVRAESLSFVDVAPARPPTAFVLVVTSATAGERFPLEPESRAWSIGRDEERDLRLTHDPYVSGQHAQIRRDGDGFDLIDGFSANGTFVNFVRLPRGGRVRLRPGDLVTVGRTLLAFQVPS